MSITTYIPPQNSNQFYLLADGRSINTNTLATTALTWRNGATAATSMPLMARIYRKTGTLLLLVGTLNLNSVVIQAVSAVQSALLGAAADPLNFAITTNTSATIIPISGDYGFTVGTINGSVSSVDCEIWGLIFR